MASGRINAKLDRDTDMSGILSLCLVASAGVGITFVSHLPLHKDTPSFQRDALYIAGKLSLAVVVLIIIVQLFRFIRNKGKYHENQTVFWPLRCSHCAFILGLSARESSYTSSDTRRLSLTGCALYENPVYQCPRRRTRQTDITCLPPPFLSSSPQLLDNPLSPEFSSEENHQDSATNDLLDTKVQSPQSYDLPVYLRNGHVYCKRSTSFLKIYGVLLIVTLISVTLALNSTIACFSIFQGSNVGIKISLISSSVQRIILIALIPVSLQFAVHYYDAVFATTINNLFTMVIFMSGAVWISIFKIATPVSELLKSPYSNSGGRCGLNSTKEEQRAVLMMTPFNAESAIIALCILWHMWVSFVRRASLRLASAHTSQRDIFQSDSCIALIKNYWSRCRVYMTRSQVCRNTLLHPSIKDLQNCLRKAWALSISLSIAYFIFSLYIECGDPFKKHSFYKKEIMWSTDIVFILPFFILHMHQSYVSRHSHETFTPISPRKVEAHDVLLLLCSCGIFCQCIMRLVAGCGLLLSGPLEPHLGHHKALSIYAIIYSLAIILMIWQMTAFLLQVQGIRMANICEIKWVLVCLIYISVANGTRWLVESISINTWHVQCAFYGEGAGNAVGTLLEPFATLYGLHAATVAYEVYKSILQGTRDQYTSVEHMVQFGDL